MDSSSTSNFGTLDASFVAAGGADGVKKLVEDFYDQMQKQEFSQDILKMHPEDIEVSIDKLYSFLSGWLGGPRLYREKYGPISIPAAHSHLTIGTKERDAWLQCMKNAIDKQPYSEDFKHYLFEQLSIPANRVMNQT